jgi:acetyl-CoA carboxylase biotin carboxylase subunit
LGIETVLAVSEADQDSLGARLADKTVAVGPPNASTYLHIPNMIQAALETGADAIHPGYGFLAEKPAFSKACREHGLIFIGPTAEQINRMGNKLVARALAGECGVPILQGSEQVETIEDVERAVKNIGYPIMLKAAAGGGGRGIKIIAENEMEKLPSAFLEAKVEAGAAFGDGTLYVEKYIARARHIEVQVLGDRFGNVIHLGERDCSTQRRHQKLIEEAGAPRLSAKQREEIRASAVKLIKNIGYEGAGTVEFIYDEAESKFYFLEMNTRIQVEHPVTEMVTGVDLVQEQIHVAGGEKLPYRQEDIVPLGHSMECRINAEAPELGFRPTPGVISRWEMPQGPGVRVDTHCYHGYKVPIFYDSLIAKVIVHGRDRDHALRRMLAALDEFAVAGISPTIPFLQKVLRSPDFREGRVHTRLLENIYSAK